jgi:hypothetical protein
MTSPKTMSRIRSGASATDDGRNHASAAATGLVQRMRLRLLALRIVAGRAPDVEQVRKTLKP